MDARPEDLGRPYRQVVEQARALYEEKRFFHWDLEFPEVFIDLERATWKENGGFDAVIGNPPYIAPENQDKEVRSYFISSDYFTTAYGRFDVYLLFYEIGICNVHNMGRVGYITPYSVLVQNYARELRKQIIDKHQVESIVDLTRLNVFQDATVSPIVMIIQKGRRGENRDFRLLKPDNNAPHDFKGIADLNTEVFKKVPNFMFRLSLRTNTIDIFRKVGRLSVDLDELVYVITGCVIYGQRGSIFGDERGKDALIYEKRVNEHCRPYVEGKEISRYGAVNPVRFLSYEPQKMHRSKFPELFENEKIFVRDIPGQQGLIATRDCEHVYSDHTLNCVVQKHLLTNVDHRDLDFTEDEISVSSNYFLEYLLAIINRALC